MPRNAETKIQTEILNALGSRRDIRLFRNPCGHGFTGETTAPRYHNGVLTVTICNARRVSFGLTPGSSDLIGLRRVLITPDMAGDVIGQFVSIEVKSERGRLTAQQKAWLEMVRRFGGFGAVARSLEDVEI